MATAVASYFSSPTPSGDFAVKISPQRPQRRRSFSMISAPSGAPPVIRTSLAGFFSLESRPLQFVVGHSSPDFSDSWETFLRVAPR